MYVILCSLVRRSPRVLVMFKKDKCWLSEYSAVFRARVKFNVSQNYVLSYIFIWAVVSHMKKVRVYRIHYTFP